MIKKTFSIILIIAAGMALLIAQTNVLKPTSPSSPEGNALGLNRPVPEESKSYDKKTPPLLSLSDAYTLALTGLGADTNQYYCVSATCLNLLPGFTPAGGHGGRGWTFEFSSTNGVQKQVLVYFDKATWVEPAAATNGGGLN